MKTLYSWKVGSRFTVDPQVVGETIAGLETATAEEIVAVATPKRSPLHDLFEWDDVEAGHQYRLAIARTIGRSLMVEVHVHEISREPIHVRAFEAVGLGGGEPRRYVSTIEALSSEEWREQIIGRLCKDLERAQKQLDVYSYLGAPVVKASKHVKLAVKALAVA